MFLWGDFWGGKIFGYDINYLSANFRKRDVAPYYLWKKRGTYLSPSLITQVNGERLGKELLGLGKASLERCITTIPCDRGFQALQYFFIRQSERRITNTAQLAKLSLVDIYHPLATDEVLMVALQLPPSQLLVERAYRRALVAHFPQMSQIPWTFTLTPPTISVTGVVMKKIAQLTLGRWLRKTPLGKESLIRPRRYFTNYSLWSRGPLRSFIEETLLDPESNTTGLFDPDGLRTLIQDNMEGRINVIGFIGQALTFAIWTRLFYSPTTPIRPKGVSILS